MSRPDDGDLKDLRRELEQRLQLEEAWATSAAAPLSDPKMRVSSFGGVVRQHFPDSVGALLQGYLHDSGGSVSTLALEVGRDEDTAARLLTSLERVSSLPSHSLVEKLAASHGLTDSAVKSLLLRALARRAIRQGGVRAQAARNKWDKGKAEDPR